MRSLSLCLALPGLVLAAFPVPEIPFQPRRYECSWTAQAPLVDGRLDDPCWEEAPWTEAFVDIRGGAWPEPVLPTRARLLWDDIHLHVAAELREPDLWATYDLHDMVIYHEHDFELFLDPDGDNHHYYELEINALGTVWDLLLTAPYRDQGCAVDSWGIPGLLSAVALQGTLNNPSDRDHGWTVELSLPWSVLEETARRPAPPRPGDVWRLNFSRVQWHLDVVEGAYHKRPDPATGRSLPEENWVWSPQGLVAMHYPERWGLLAFVKEGAPPPDGPGEWSADELAAAETLMQVYYAQCDRRDGGLPFTDRPDPRPLPEGWAPVAATAAEGRFLAWTSRRDGLRLSVDEGGRLLRQWEDGK